MANIAITKSDNHNARKALLLDLMANTNISSLVPDGMSHGDFLSVIDTLLVVDRGYDDSVVYS